MKAFVRAAPAADLKAGLAAAVVSLPQSVPLGVIGFAPLGPEWLWLGALSGLYSAIFAGLTAALLGGTPLLVSGPRASASLIVAAIVAGLLHHHAVQAHGGEATAVTLAFAAIFLAGVLQAGFGALRWGRFIKYIPYPVIAGFMNGVAVLILLGQVAPALGLPEGVRLSDLPAVLANVKPGAVAITAIAILGMVVTPRLTKAVPAPLAGLLAGGVAFHLLAQFVPAGQVVGTLPTITLLPGLPAAIWALPPGGWVLEPLLAVAPSILVLAVVGSVDTLLSCASLDSLTGGRHDSNRELVGQGVSNMVAALFAGVASTGSLARSGAAVKAGARTRLAAVICSVVLLVVTVAAGPLLALVPLPAMAGIMVMIALAAFDGWSRQLMWRLPRQAELKREIVANLLVVIIVAAATVLVNLVAAVAAGVALSMALFVRKMSKPIVRRVSDGTARRSLKVRGREEADLLLAHGRAILVVELDGPLFFGTADALQAEVAQRAHGVRVVVLDGRRLSEMDATGVRILGQLGRDLQKNGRAFVLTHLAAEEGLGRFLLEMGGAEIAQSVRLFPDTDAALEWAEDRILELRGRTPEDSGELRLPDLPLADGLSADELHVLAGALVRRELPAGITLFREGEPGESLFLLAKGAVTIRLERAGAPPVRLATFQPGVMFGEMSILEGQPRSADAIAEADVVLYELDVDTLAGLADTAPGLTQHLLLNIARDLAARLRVTSAQLRAAH